MIKLYFRWGNCGSPNKVSFGDCVVLKKNGLDNCECNTMKKFICSSMK